MDRLKKDLLVDYDRLTRPASYDTPTDCWIGLTVINMELDETKGVLETHAWMRLNWSDPKMTWDPSQYGGVKQLNLAADEVSCSYLKFHFYPNFCSKGLAARCHSL